MSTARKQPAGNMSSLEGAAEELSAALEASTARASDTTWRDPVSPAQLKEAFDRLLLSPRPDRGLSVLVRSGVLKAVMPELAALVGFGEGIRHKDVWDHTLKVVRQAPRRLNVRWAALLHDIGKVRTRKFRPDGQVTFLGHPEVGARMFDRIARRFPFLPDSKERIRFLIACHLRASAYDETWTDAAVRRFGKDMDAALDDLLDLSRADITSKHLEKVRRGLRQIDLLANRVERIKELDAKPAPLPKGLGTALIEQFDLVPGPSLGALMRHLQEEVESGRLGLQQGHEHYLSYVAEHPSLLEDYGKEKEHDKRRSV